MTHSSRCATALVAALAVLAAPIAMRTAAAEPTAEARQHYQKGKQLFDSGDYRRAMAEFATADKLAPSPMLEFNIALCHERLGERAEAVRRYRLYLDRVPDAQNRTDVEQKIQKLESELKAEAAPPPPPAEQAGPPPSAGAPPPAEAAPAPTGDPDLDRVAGIDVGKVRAQREGSGGGASAPPPAARSGEGGAAATAESQPADDGGKKKSKPIYKQWWFWVVAGVSAIILIDIATAGSDDSDSAASRFMPSPGARDVGGQGGAVLLRF